MRYGLVLPNFGHYSDVRLLAELAHEAEEAGWDGFFLTDTIQMIGYEKSPMCDPWIALAAVALRTERIKIGVRVAAPTRTPSVATGQGGAHAGSPLQGTLHSRRRCRG